MKQEKHGLRLALHLLWQIPLGCMALYFGGWGVVAIALAIVTTLGVQSEWHPLLWAFVGIIGVLVGALCAAPILHFYSKDENDDTFFSPE